MRYLLTTLDSVESNSGLQSCMYLNKTTSSINSIVYDKEFMNVVHSLMLFCGLLVVFYGNKLVKPVVFLTGMTLGTVAGSYSAMAVSKWYTLECNTLYAIAAISGIIGASFALSIYKIANALIGVAFGGSAGYFLYNLGLNYIEIGEFLGHDWMYWISVGVPALVGAYVCVNKNRELLIILTPFPGALMFLYAIDQLLISNVSGSSAFTKLEWTNESVSQYIYAGIWVIISLFGIIVQKRGYIRRAYYGDNASLFERYDD